MRFLFILLVLVPFINSFSQYSYLLDLPLPDFAKILLEDSCPQFLSSFSLPKGIPFREPFKESLELAKSAEKELSSARFYARISSLYLEIEPARRLFNLPCISHGFNALYYASSSAKLGLEAIALQQEELEKVYDPSYSGMASASVSEIREAISKISSMNSSGSSFASFLIKSSKIVSLTFGGKEVFNSVDLLVGRDSLLKQEILFYERILSSVSEIKDEEDRLSSFIQQSLVSIKSRLDEMNSEELYLISPEYLSFVETKGVFSSGNPGSIYLDVRHVSSLYKELNSLFSEAKKLSSSKEKGALSREVMLLRKLVKNATNLMDSVELIFSNAASLESFLESRASTEISSLIQETDAIKLDNPFAFNLLKSRISKIEEQIHSGSKTIGSRIRSLLNSLHLVSEARKLLKHSASSQDLRQLLNENANAFSQKLSLARKDFSVDAYFKELSSILSSADSLQDSSDAVSSLLLLQNKLEELEERFISAISLEYSVLEDYFEKLSSLSDFLEPSLKQRFYYYTQFFNGNSLDFKRALGSLSAMRSFFESTLASLETRTPVLLKKRLEELSKAIFSRDVSQINSDSFVVAAFFVKNDLPLSYGFPIELSFAELSSVPDDFELINKSPEISFSSGKLFLSSVSPFSDYFIYLRFRERFASVYSEEWTTVRADKNSAEKRLLVKFNSKKKGTVVYQNTFSFPSSVTVSGKGVLNSFFSSDSESTFVKVLIDSIEGENELVFSFRISSPFSINEFHSIEGSSIKYSFVFSSPFTSFEKATLSFLENLPCFPENVFADGLPNEKTVFGRALSISFKDSFLKGETKEAFVLIECGHSEQDVLSKLLELEFRAKNVGLLFSSEFSLVRQLISEKRFSQAFSKLLSLEELISKKEESLAYSSIEKNDSLSILPNNFDKSFNEKQALLSDYPSKKDYALSLLNACENAFSLPPGISSREPLKVQATSLAKSIQSVLKKLDLVWEALETSDFNSFGKYSLSYVSENLASLSDSCESLESIISQMKEKAVQEISLAQTKQKQFGSSETQESVSFAEESFDKGFYLTAFVSASELNKALPSTETGFSKEENNFFLFGLIGACILVLLFLVFLKRGSSEPIEVQ